MNQKIKINYDRILKWISFGSIGLLILALCFKTRTLIIAAELLIFLSILGMIFSAIYSLASKYEQKQNDTNEQK